MVALKTTRGERIDIHIPHNASVRQAIDALVEQHQYHPTTKLMGGREILEPHRRINEFADGSLMIVGATTRSVAASRNRSPQPSSKIRATHHHPSPTAAQPSHPSSVDTGAHPAGSSPPKTSPQRSATPQPEKIVVKGVIPALQSVIDIPLVGSATLADLVTAALSMDTRLAGCKIAFRGKFIVGPMDKTLHSFGIRDGDSIHLATGPFCDVNVLSLFRIEEDLTRISGIIDGTPSLSEQERKGLYEELMRVLFRTDDLQEVEGELRMKRKEMVKRITSLQDRLKPPTAA